jgi:hypothetical protein
MPVGEWEIQGSSALSETGSGSGGDHGPFVGVEARGRA